MELLDQASNFGNPDALGPELRPPSKGLSWLVVSLTLLLPLSACAESGERLSSHGCTAAEQHASDALYDADGLRRVHARGPLVKWCGAPAAENSYKQWCNKAGFGPVIAHVQANILWYWRLLLASEETYEAYDVHFKHFHAAQARFEQETLTRARAAAALNGSESLAAKPTGVQDSQRPYHPAGRKKYAYVDKRTTVMRGTDRLILPQIGQVFYYEDRATLSTFSLAMLPGDPEGWIKQRLVVAFRGSVPFAESKDFTDANLKAFLGAHSEAYLGAGLIGGEINQLLISAGQGCSTKVIYTGHSLGGGLALEAGTMSGLRCRERRPDNIVVFNPARLRGSNVERSVANSRYSSSVNQITLVATEWDVVKWLHHEIPGPLLSVIDFLLSSTVMDLSSGYRVLKLENLESAAMGPVSDHLISSLKISLSTLRSKIPEAPARIPEEGVRSLCRAYTP